MSALEARLNTEQYRGRFFLRQWMAPSHFSPLRLNIRSKGTVALPSPKPSPATRASGYSIPDTMTATRRRYGTVDVR